MVKTEFTFEEILDRTIDDTIRSIMGEGTAEIYYHMKDYGVRSDSLGENLEELERAMSEIFKIGWNIFRKAILRSLSQQLNVSIDKFANHDFVDCIEIARSEFLMKNASSTQDQMVNMVQYSKLKASTAGILKLSLPEIEPRAVRKTCKVCEKAIDTTNKNMEGLLAELCDKCWESQNSVWEFTSEEAEIPQRTAYNKGDVWI